jgi:hypothetical protein
MCSSLSRQGRKRIINKNIIAISGEVNARKVFIVSNELMEMFRSFSAKI